MLKLLISPTLRGRSCFAGAILLYGSMRLVVLARVYPLLLSDSPVGSTGILAYAGTAVGSRYLSLNLSLGWNGSALVNAATASNTLARTWYYRSISAAQRIVTTSSTSMERNHPALLRGVCTFSFFGLITMRCDHTQCISHRFLYPRFVRLPRQSSPKNWPLKIETAMREPT